MLKSATLRLAVLTAALACALALALIACGPPRGGSPAVGGADSTTTGSGGFPTTDSVLAELNALPCPDGVDGALWGELKAALEAALKENRSGELQFATPLISRPRGRESAVGDNHGRDARPTKSISTPPTGDANRVNDLAISDNGDGTYTLSWHYRNAGDYGQDGRVGIEDITPLAQHFNETYDPETEPHCIQAVIDGSGNGKVDIADITALAANFQSELAAYAVERSPTAAEEFGGIATLTLEDAAGEGRKRFAHTIPLARRAHYRVVPRSPDGQPGVPSEPFDFRLESGTWRMFGKDARHNLRSPYTGPQAPEVKWTIEPSEFKPPLQFGWHPVVNGEGTAFVTSIAGEIGLWAIGPDGEPQWSYTLADQVMPEFAGPALAEDGTVYFSSTTHLFALNPDGSLKWELELPEACRFSSPTLARDGTIYLGTGDGYDYSEDGRLLAFSPDGSLLWEYPVGQDIVPTAAVAEDGTIYSATYRGTVFALNPDGSLQWELEVGEEGAIWSSPAIADDGMVYIGIQGGRWVFDYESGYLCAISPGGSLKWKFETAGWVSSTPAIAADGTVYACSIGGYLYAVSPDGELRWQYDTGSAMAGNPAVGGDGLIYLAPTSGELYAFLPDGTLAWTYATPATATYLGTNVVLGEDGVLYLSWRTICFALGDDW